MAFEYLLLSENNDQFEKNLTDFNDNIQQSIERGEKAKFILEQDKNVYQTLTHPNSGLSMGLNFDSFFKDVTQWEKDSLKIIEEIARTTITERRALIEASETVNELFESARDNLDQIQELIEMNAVEKLAAIEKGIETKKIILISVLIVTILIVALFGWMIVSSILSAIKNLLHVTNKIAEGDLTENNINIRSNDEIGQLMKSVNMMSNNLKALVSSVNNSVKEVGSSAENLSAISEEVAASVDEIAASIDEVAKGAEQEANETEETNQKTYQLLEKMKEVQKYTEEMTERSDEAEQASKDGLKQINTLHATSTQTNEVILTVSEVIDQLVSKVRNIEEITVAISRISDQTNLLALNASIEAARAGEHGKGFAVVADEVRKLAEESSVAANNINHMIHNIVSETNVVLKTVKETEMITEQQEKVVNDTEQIFTIINASIKNIARSINNINQGMVEMNILRDGVATSIESISAITEQSAAAIEQISISTNEQLSAINIVSSSSESLNLLSDELEKLIATFKL